jgi:hypothetical protein
MQVRDRENSDSTVHLCERTCTADTALLCPKPVCSCVSFSRVCEPKLPQTTPAKPVFLRPCCAVLRCAV